MVAVSLGQWWCAWRHRHQGCTLGCGQDAIWIYCWRCGYYSPGIEIDVKHVRVVWTFDYQRKRFRKAS